MLNILDNVRLGKLVRVMGTQLVNRGTYMAYPSHNPHFHVNLLVNNAVFHEATLFKLFRGVASSIEFGSDQIYNSKSSFADLADFVVFRPAIPCFYPSADLDVKRRSTSLFDWFWRKEVRLWSVNNMF